MPSITLITDQAFGGAVYGNSRGNRGPEFPFKQRAKQQDATEMDILSPLSQYIH
jgi:hypothetical protein